ncbi:MAG: HlyD family efflux transporter periplasmic adaptor subunit [Flavobacteriaceae bacterium]|nr:HlyD family efflux transporter periplasmic adaptor subunit [Flavobacteriaceae bacterium]|tara:strand:- start:559 stop:1704 length:1146 start_codon:yes stop_codon:yes gene_type:complete
MFKNTSFKSLRKLILFFLGFGIVALSYQLSKKIIDSNPPPRKKAENTIKEVYTIKVKNGPYQAQIPSKGVLQAYKRVKITARVRGVMQTITPLFKTGQEYRFGQILTKIEPSEFRANVISQRAALYNLITSILPDLQLDFPNAYNQWNKYLKGFDLEKPVPKLPVMEEKVRLFVSGRGIISSYYSLQNLENTLTFYEIRAPFNGVLVSTNVTEGSLISPGQELGEFIAPGDYELMVALPKSYVSKITKGASVKVKSIDTDQIFTGIVSRINAKVNIKTQSVEVYIRMSDARLKEGMYMEADINAIEFSSVFALDRGLLNGSKQIFIVKDNKLILRKVSPIHFTETLAIINGLDDGEEIVAQPLIGAYSGMEINPIPFNKSK